MFYEVLAQLPEPTALLMVVRCADVDPSCGFIYVTIEVY